MIQNLDRLMPSDPASICCQGAMRLNSMIQYLRTGVFADCQSNEKFHTIFISPDRSFLGQMTFDNGNCSELSLRMRDLFSNALHLGSGIMIIAHNHPSGDCRPSRTDIRTTARIKALSEALDIQLADHLIFTQTAVYSMRAGGDL